MERDSVGKDDATPGAIESAHGQRDSWELIATQFQGTYSDNILRNLLLSMIVGMGLARSEREAFVSIVTAICPRCGSPSRTSSFTPTHSRC